MKGLKVHLHFKKEGDVYEPSNNVTFQWVRFCTNDRKDKTGSSLTFDELIYLANNADEFSIASIKADPEIKDLTNAFKT